MKVEIFQIISLYISTQTTKKLFLPFLETKGFSGITTRLQSKESAQVKGESRTSNSQGSSMFFCVHINFLLEFQGFLPLSFVSPGIL